MTAQQTRAYSLWGITHSYVNSVRPGRTFFVNYVIMTSQFYCDHNDLPNNDEMTPLIFLVINELAVFKCRAIVSVDIFGVFFYFAYLND